MPLIHQNSLTHPKKGRGFSLFQYNAAIMTRSPLWSLTLLTTLLTACASQTPDPNLQIQGAVAATIAAIPTTTQVPTPTPYPTPTPFTLAGFYCEYQFCIGHPKEVAFFDVSAQQNPASPSSYGQGLLAAFNSGLFIQMMWQLAPGTSDPQFLLDLILEDGVDTRSGDMDIKLVRGMNVIFIPITSTATSVLPFGSAAAWTCGERVFAWKAYTPNSETPQALFEEALARFTCSQ